MTWLCDFERCYRVANLIVLPDGRRRPRCGKHEGQVALYAEDKDAIDRQAIDAREKPARTGWCTLATCTLTTCNTKGEHVHVNFPVEKEIAFYFKSLEERVFDESVRESEKLGVLPQIPPAKDEAARYDAMLERMAKERGTICVRTSDSAEMPPETKRLIYDMSLLDADSRKAVENLNASRFKAGDWVRFVRLGRYGQEAANMHMGRLGEVRDVHNEGQSFASVSVYSEAGAYLWSFDQIEPALPRAGEWWMWKTCATHGQRANYADVAFAIPSGWPDGLGPEGKPRVPEYVACGCLAPVNFGRGEAK